MGIEDEVEHTWVVERLSLEEPGRLDHAREVERH